MSTFGTSRRATRGSTVLGQSDPEVDAERIGDFLPEELAGRDPRRRGGSAHRRAIRTCACGSRASCPAPRSASAARAARRPGPRHSTSSSVKSPSTSGSPAWWLSTCRTVIASLPLAANSGQYVATGRVGIEQPTLDREVGADGGDALRRREHGHDRVRRPRAAGRRVGEPAPEVDHRFDRRGTRTPPRRPRRARRSWR